MSPPTSLWLAECSIFARINHSAPFSEAQLSNRVGGAMAPPYERCVCKQLYKSQITALGKIIVYFSAKMCYTTTVRAGWADPGTLGGSCATRLRRPLKITYDAGVFLWNGDTGPEKRTAVAYFSCRKPALIPERSLYFGRKTENYPPWRFG